jgi:pimeloyl-ACP methyl ester carboxylesterase
MKPVLLLVPGMLNDERIWSQVAAQLDDVAQVRVAHVLTQSSLTEMARDAWRLVNSSPVDTPLVLAGFSMGGYVVMEMISQMARPLDGVAFLSTSSRPESPEGMVVRQKTIEAMQTDFPKVVEGILKWSTYRANEALTQDLRQMMLDLGSEVAIRQTRAIMARKDHRALLAGLTCPVRLLCGQSDRVTPPELIQELSSLIPHAPCQIVEDSGHMLPREQADLVAHHLRQMLA